MNTMSSRLHDYDLLELHGQREANQISGFRRFMAGLDVEKLVIGYQTLCANAPRRREREKPYFTGHDGVPSGSEHSNRREEHLAMALWNDFEELGEVDHPEITSLRLLDYQFPLKARRGDRGVGKVDLFAAVDDGVPCVVELKVGSGNGLGDTPLRAFLEALAYCAIVEANIHDIAREPEGSVLEPRQPRLMVMATASYWDAWSRHHATGHWQPPLRDLVDAITDRVGLRTHFVALHDAEFSMGGAGRKPRLDGPSRLKPAF